MKLTSNINLGGCSFTIDNDAYTMLENYFESLKTMFRAEGVDDPEDLVNDIEVRCAEILNETLTPGEIITIGHVRAIMKRMGEPEELAEIRVETCESNGESTTERVRETIAEPPLPPRVKRRLFRDPNDKLIGGVCSGIAAYTGIDPTWVRLITIILMFLSFSTVLLVYIILWIVVPEAKTPLQRLQMEGEAPTMENIGKSVNSIFTKNDRPASDSPVESGHHQFTDVLIQIFAILGKVLLVTVGLAGAGIMLGCVLGLVASIIAIVCFLIGSPIYLISAISSGMPVSAGNPMLGLIFISATLLCVGLLLFFVLYGIWRVFFKGHLSQAAITVLSVLCALSGVAAIVCWFIGI